MKIKFETLCAIQRSLSDIRDKYEIDNIKNKSDSDKELDWLYEKFEELENSINQEGKVFAYVYRAYFISMGDDNEHINFHENLDSRFVPEIVTCLRENDVEYFTFSSAYGNSVDTVCSLIQNGCTVIGATEVNRLGNSRRKDYDKENALLFKVEKASQQTDELRQRIMKFNEEYEQWDYDAEADEKATIEEMVYGLRCIKEEMDRDPAIEMDDDLKVEFEELIRLTADMKDPEWKTKEA